jgi:branched-chain amino acid transport system substrate-binding protein
MARLLRPVVAIAALMLAAGTTWAQDIKIAVVGPLTGSNAALGEQMKRGAEMAVADINKKGGVLGQKLALTIADDACDPKQAAVRPMTWSAKGRLSPGITARRLDPGLGRLRRSRCLADHPGFDQPGLTDDALPRMAQRVPGVRPRRCPGPGCWQVLADHYKDKKIDHHDKTAYGRPGRREEGRQRPRAKEVMYRRSTRGRISWRWSAS